MSASTCDGCKATRPKGQQWFYVYPDITPSKNAKPSDTRCPACADPAIVEARRVARAEKMGAVRSARKVAAKP